ncbi:hypothetical protein Droror1_Dr00026677 [Drosera rotundifolia]
MDYKLIILSDVFLFLLLDTYETCQPFIEDDHFVHKYFLPQECAILIPVYAGVTLISFLFIFVRFVALSSKKKKA